MDDSKRYASFVKGDELEILRIVKMYGVPTKKIKERLCYLREHTCQYALAAVNETKTKASDSKRYNKLLDKNEQLIETNKKQKKEIDMLMKKNLKLEKMMAIYDKTTGR